MIKEYNYYITTNRFSQIAEDLETTVRSYAENIGKKDENELREKARSLCSSHLVSSGLRSKENSFINIDAEFFDGGELLEANLNRFIKDVLKAHGYQKVLWEYMGTTGMMTEISKSAMKIDGFNYENYLPAGLKEKEASKKAIKLNRNFNRLQDDSGFDWSRGYDPNDTIEKKGWFSDYDENRVWTRYVTNGEKENAEKINSSEKIFKIKLIKTEKGCMLYDPGMILLNPILLWYLTQDDEVYGAEESDTLKIVNEIKTQMKKIGVTKITEIAWGNKNSVKSAKAETIETTENSVEKRNREICNKYKNILNELAAEKLTVISSVQAEITAEVNATAEKTALIQKEAQNLQNKIDAVIKAKPDCNSEDLVRYIQTGKTEMPVDIMEQKDAELAGLNEAEYQSFISFAAELQGKQRTEFSNICAVLSAFWNEYKSCARSKEECMKLLFDYVKENKENDFNYELTLKQVLELPVQQSITETENVFDEKVTERIIRENLPQENQGAALEYIASLPEQPAENKSIVYKTLCSAVKNYLTIRMSTGMSIKELLDYAVKTSGGKLPKASFTPPVTGYINLNAQNQTAKDSTGEKRIYFEGKVSGLFDALKVHKLPQKEVLFSVLEDNYEKAQSKKRKPVVKIGFTESGSKSVTEENNSLWFDVGEIENINPVILAILKSIYIEDKEIKTKVLTIAKTSEEPEAFVSSLAKEFKIEYNFADETARQAYLLEKTNVSEEFLSEYVQDFEEEAEKTVSSKEYVSSNNAEITPVFTQVDFKDLKSEESVSENDGTLEIKTKNKIALPTGYHLMQQKTSAGGVLEKITRVSARKFETESEAVSENQSEKVDSNSSFVIEKADSIDETYLNLEEKKKVKLLFKSLNESEKKELIYAAGEDWNNITPLLLKEFIWRKQNKKSTQNILQEITVYEKLKEIPQAELEKYLVSSTVNGEVETVRFNRQSQSFYEGNSINITGNSDSQTINSLSAKESISATKKKLSETIPVTGNKTSDSAADLLNKQSVSQQISETQESEKAVTIKSNPTQIPEAETAIPVIKLTPEEKEYLHKTYGLQTEELSPVIQEYIKSGEWKNERNLLLLKDAINQTEQLSEPSETVKLFMEKLSSFDKEDLLYAADGDINNITPLFIKEFIWRKNNNKSVKKLYKELNSYTVLKTMPEPELQKLVNISTAKVQPKADTPVVKLTKEDKVHYKEVYGINTDSISPVVQAYIKSGEWRKSRSATGVSEVVQPSKSISSNSFVQNESDYNNESGYMPTSITNVSLSRSGKLNPTSSAKTHTELPHSTIQTHKEKNSSSVSGSNTEWQDSNTPASVSDTAWSNPNIASSSTTALSETPNAPLSDTLKESLSHLAEQRHAKKQQSHEMTKLDRINSNYEHDKAVLAKNDPLFAKNQFWDVGHAEGSGEKIDEEKAKKDTAWFETNLNNEINNRLGEVL